MICSSFVWFHSDIEIPKWYGGSIVRICWANALSMKWYVKKWYEPVVYNWVVSGNIKPKKPYKENWQNSRRFFNYIKSSCIIPCAKMSRYFQVIYCLQEESTHFGAKDFELKQVLLCSKIPWFNHLYSINAHLKHLYYSLTLSLKIGSFSFFSSSDMRQSHHLVGCHATGTNSLLISF